MMLQNEHELTSTREKLRMLEESYEEVRQETGVDEALREAEMASLQRFIKQLKEEIAWYQTRASAQKSDPTTIETAGSDRNASRRRVLNEVELANTKRKLSDLERLYEAHEHETGGDMELREVSMRSLKRTINQLKEEIIWTEVHQPVSR